MGSKERREHFVRLAKARRSTMAKAPRRAPRITPLDAPKGVQKSYYIAIRSMLRDARELVISRLLPELPGLIEASKPRRDSARLDSPADDVNDVIRRIAKELFNRWPNSKILKTAEDMGRRTNEYSKQQIRAMFAKSVGIDVTTLEPWLSTAINNFTVQNAEYITSIAEDYLKDVAHKVTSGMRQGMRHEELAEQIEERYGVSESKAKLIARDQINKFNGELTKHRQEDVGVEKYRWKSSGDNRVRDSHSDRDGKLFTWEEGTGISGDRHPGEAINCRCWAEPVLDDILEELS